MALCRLAGRPQSFSRNLCCWGNEDGNRTFDIFVDGTLIATENTSGRWGRDEFVEEEYSIPRELIDGKVTITVRFTGRRGHTAGGIYHVRLLHPEK